MEKGVRKDPLGLVAAAQAGPKTRVAETARQNNTQLGACPVCGQQMQIVNAGGIPSYVCMDHCVCLPTKD